MGFFSLFSSRQANTSDATAQEISSNTLDIKKEDFVDDTPPTGNGSTILIQYGTGQPIDLIYGYLKEDYEAKGYDDALSNPDTSYKDMNKSIIKSNLEVKFKQVRLRYEDDLRKLNFHIESRSQAGLVDVVKQLKSERDRLEYHLKELDKMEQDFQNNAPYMVGILLSYERGFVRGLAALSLEIINKKD